MILERSVKNGQVDFLTTGASRVPPTLCAGETGQKERRWAWLGVYILELAFIASETGRLGTTVRVERGAAGQGRSHRVRTPLEAPRIDTGYDEHR